MNPPKTTSVETLATGRGTLVHDLTPSYVATVMGDIALVDATPQLPGLRPPIRPVTGLGLRLRGIVCETRPAARIGIDSPQGDNPILIEATTKDVLTAAADIDLARVAALVIGRNSTSLAVLLPDVIGMIRRSGPVHAIAHGELDAQHTDEHSQR